MANYKNGINGPSRGKVGQVVAVERYGKNHMRSLPDFSTYHPTAKQAKQRKLLALLSGWLKPLKNLIKLGFQLVDPGKTPMNEAFALNYKEAIVEVNGQPEINYPKVILSKGELLISFILEFLSLLQSVIHIKWENALGSVINQGDDKATFVVYNPLKDSFVTFVDVAQRVDKEAILKLPDNFSDDNVHCWMQYVSSSGEQVSSSIYVGEIVVG